MGLKSKHEVSEGPKAPRGGKAVREEGGFVDGEMGRGPTPYKKSHSAAPGSLKQHMATSGRGDAGRFGKGDEFKTHAQDLEHPASHADFEELGRS